jgi:hypothetical protein
MTLSRGTLKLLIVVVFLGVALVNVSATPLAPQAPSSPPETSTLSPAGSGVVSQPSSVNPNLPPLKAVLMVGPIDGDNGSWTSREKQSMDLAAAELEVHGVDVYKFYTPDNDWEQIKAAAEGAHFLFYRGHGVYWTPMPDPNVGGFYLKGKFVSPEDIRNDLHLAPNAIVMLYGCFTAGSSSVDDDAISSQEAQRRVGQYSDPFLEIGVGGYFADWYGDAFQKFVRYLFQGMAAGQAYEAYADFNGATVERYVHPDFPRAVMWLDKDNWGYTKYNNAFVGLPDRTLVDLFGANVMTLSPQTIDVQTEASSAPHTFSVQVDATGSDTFNWIANVSPADAAWLTVEPLSGSRGQQMTVVIDPKAMAESIYEARIQIVAETSEIENRKQDIPVTLHVLGQMHTTFFPVVGKVAP